jgi:hypothetical protein
LKEISLSILFKVYHDIIYSSTFPFEQADYLEREHSIIANFFGAAILVASNMAKKGEGGKSERELRIALSRVARERQQQRNADEAENAAEEHAAEEQESVEVISEVDEDNPWAGRLEDDEGSYDSKDRIFGEEAEEAEEAEEETEEAEEEEEDETEKPEEAEQEEKEGDRRQERPTPPWRTHLPPRPRMPPVAKPRPSVPRPIPEPAGAPPAKAEGPPAKVQKLTPKQPSAPPPRALMAGRAAKSAKEGVLRSGKEAPPKSPQAPPPKSPRTPPELLDTLSAQGCSAKSGSSSSSAQLGSSIPSSSEAVAVAWRAYYAVAKGGSSKATCPKCGHSFAFAHGEAK